MVRGILCVAALALCGAKAPVPQVPFAKAIMASHNAARAEAGVAPLRWNAQLAADAAVWARHLAKTRSFEHSTVQHQGENLWMGTRARYAPAEMVDAWIDEKSDYRPGKFPHVSRTSHWMDVGHYTQLIWASTTQVGCAVASNGEDDYLVCRYDPPGNWVGKDPVRH